MSLYINFEPHGWYKGFAIQKTNIDKNDITDYPYNAYWDNGITGYLVELHATTLKEIKQLITNYRWIK